MMWSSRITKSIDDSGGMGISRSNAPVAAEACSIVKGEKLGTFQNSAGKNFKDRGRSRRFVGTNAKFRSQVADRHGRKQRINDYGQKYEVKNLLTVTYSRHDRIDRQNNGSRTAKPDQPYIKYLVEF
jgi:hypothetical protein